MDLVLARNNAAGRRQHRCRPSSSTRIDIARAGLLHGAAGIESGQSGGWFQARGPLVFELCALHAPVVDMELVGVVLDGFARPSDESVCQEQRSGHDDKTMIPNVEWT